MALMIPEQQTKLWWPILANVVRQKLNSMPHYRTSLLRHLRYRMPRQTQNLQCNSWIPYVKKPHLKAPLIVRKATCQGPHRLCPAELKPLKRAELLMFKKTIRFLPVSCSNVRNTRVCLDQSEWYCSRSLQH